MIAFIIYIVGCIVSVVAMCLELCKEHPSEKTVAECIGENELILIFILSILSWISVLLTLIGYIISVSKNPFYKND